MVVAAVSERVDPAEQRVCACLPAASTTRPIGTRLGLDTHGNLHLSLFHSDHRSTMSHHLFLLSPSDTPLYELTHYSSKPVPTTASPLAANLPSWSTSAFAGTLTALSGASSAAQTHNTQGGPVRMGGGKDRHVIQMIANASLDAIEEVMRKENVMCVGAVFTCVPCLIVRSHQVF